MTLLRLMVVSAVALMTNASMPSPAFAASVAGVAQDFQWVDLSACKKPPTALPPAAKETYETYNVQRRYVDLDKDGTCEAMDVWIERLGENPSPGMRTLNQNYFRYKGGKWTEVSADLKFYPYAIRSVKTGEMVYIEAASKSDIGDDIALGTQEMKVLVPSGWDETPGFRDTLVLKPYQGRPGPFQQALAVFLTERLLKQEADPKKGLATNPRFKWYQVDEREKIRWILKEAGQTLKAEERVPVDGKGLPALEPR